jgi:hypothetical protein
MESRKYAIRTFGVDIKKVPGISTGLTDDESLLLAKIKEYQRISQYVSKRLPGEDFEIDEELSEQCCSHGWN